MVRDRVPETDEGIQSVETVKHYDIMQKGLRDRGNLPVDSIIKSGICSGNVLEIGQGPGYLGLEWLKQTSGTILTCFDISPAMLELAGKNAVKYGFSDRTLYIEGNAMDMHEINDSSFDGVFSNGSLHEWEEPAKVFNEILRVLKPCGCYFISDLKRDTDEKTVELMKSGIEQKEILDGFISSLNASYTRTEAEQLLKNSNLTGYYVGEHQFGIFISGKKE